MCRYIRSRVYSPVQCKRQKDPITKPTTKTNEHHHVNKMAPIHYKFKYDLMTISVSSLCWGHERDFHTEHDMNHTFLMVCLQFWFETGADVEQYLHYVGGAAGMLALTGVGVGVAAASAYYLASRPTPTVPPFDLDRQTIVEVNVSSSHLHHWLQPKILWNTFKTEEIIERSKQKRVPPRNSKTISGITQTF